MERYVLLLHGTQEPFKNLSPEELQAIIGKYKAWRQRLQDSGRLVGSNKLEDGTGRVMRANGSGKVQITDGPFTESKEMVGGYFIIEAADYNEAVEQCRDCPHLGNGTVEIRRIQVV
jgi:hypothetical protein